MNEEEPINLYEEYKKRYLGMPLYKIPSPPVLLKKITEERNKKRDEIR